MDYILIEIASVTWSWIGLLDLFNPCANFQHKKARASTGGFVFVSAMWPISPYRHAWVILASFGHFWVIQFRWSFVSLKLPLGMRTAYHKKAGNTAKDKMTPGQCFAKNLKSKVRRIFFAVAAALLVIIYPPYWFISLAMNSSSNHLVDLPFFSLPSPGSSFRRIVTPREVLVKY